MLREQTQRRSQTNTATAAHTTRSRILPQLRFVLALALTHYYCDVKQSHNTRPHDYGHCCIYYSISYTTKAYHYLFSYSRTRFYRQPGRRVRDVVFLKHYQPSLRDEKVYGGESSLIRGGITFDSLTRAAWRVLNRIHITNIIANTTCAPNKRYITPIVSILPPSIIVANLAHSRHYHKTCYKCQNVSHYYSAPTLIQATIPT